MDIAAATGSEAARLTNAANDLGPTIAGMREEIERERRLPLPLVERLRELGLFSLWLARDFGGPELSLSDYMVRVIETVARLDGSVGWCVMNAAAYSIFSGLLTEPVARRIFVDQQAVVAGTGAARGKAVPVSGGYRVTGRWAYGSGIMHSDWVIGGCVVLEGDAPRRKPGGGVETRILFFPTSSVEVIHTWQVGGLRGTGSHDFQVADLFVPSSHTVSGEMDDPHSEGRSTPCQKTRSSASPLPRFPLGIARAALDEVKDLSVKDSPNRLYFCARNQCFKLRSGRAEALLRGARAFLLEACDDAWNTASAGVPLTLNQRALVRLWRA